MISVRPAAENYLEWNEWDEGSSQARPFQRQKLWILVLASFLYCVSSFWKMQPAGPAPKDPLADFLRKYLSLTGGCRHYFQRSAGTNADWVVYSRPDKAAKAGSRFGYTMVRLGKRLEIYRFPADATFQASGPSREDRELESFEFRAPIAVKEESNSRFFSSLDKPPHKFSRWLTFSEGPVPCGEVSISLTQPRYTFQFNQQFERASVTCNGALHIAREDLEQRKTTTLFWRLQNVCLAQTVNLSLADCREGTVTVQPPKKLWLLALTAQIGVLLSDSGVILAVSLLMTGLALLAFDRILTSKPPDFSVDPGIRRTARSKNEMT